MEWLNVSDMSAGQDAIDQLDARVQRLGNTLSAPGWERSLSRLGDALPDANQRLAHVGRMTQNAAVKVRNLVHLAQPICRDAAADADQLASRLACLHKHADLGVGEARAALAEAADTLRHQADLARRQASLLSDIMLAQDFQDLSGQVVNKALLIISQAEQQLRQLLAQDGGTVVLPAATAAPNLSNGPQVPAKAVAQQDVDDLLASMGF